MKGRSILIAIFLLFWAVSVFALDSLDGSQWEVKIAGTHSGTINFTKKKSDNVKEKGTYTYDDGTTTYNGTYTLKKAKGKVKGKHKVSAKVKIIIKVKIQSDTELGGWWIKKKKNKQGKWQLVRKDPVTMTRVTGPPGEEVPEWDVDLRIGSATGQSLRGGVTINKGQNLVLSVVIRMPDNGNPDDLVDVIGAYSITLYFNSTVFRFVSITGGDSLLGDPLASNEKQSGELIFNDINADANAGGAPDKSAVGYLDVARITFTVKGDAPSGDTDIVGKLNVLTNANVSQQNPGGETLGGPALTGADIFGSGTVTIP